MYGGGMEIFMDITKIDKNFKIETALTEPGLVFHNALDNPFKIYGVFYEDNHFVRMPGKVAKEVNEGVATLYNHTAGGRVRFITDSPFVAVSCKTNNLTRMSHITVIGSCGMDLFADNTFVGSYFPPFIFENEKGYESILYVNKPGEYEVTINMPLYCGVNELYIGLKEGSVIKEPTPYADVPPIVYYGSSITQGGCASRPGNAYQNIIQREINIDHINLGFSGSGRAEDTIIDYLASLDMSFFVMDYDHNAPDVEHLRNTHEKLFRGIRAKHPELPVLIVSKPDILRDPNWAARRDLIKSNYEKFVSEGDKNVYFIDGSTMFVDHNLCTVDGCHPNDLGFYCMAQKIGGEIKRILNI